MADAATHQLTDRAFWADYWNAKAPSLLAAISPDYLFSKTLARFLPTKPGLEFVEIGGFPGFFSVFFKKYYQYNATLIDCYVDRKIVDQLSVMNGLAAGTVDVIEADFFNFETDKRFDLVMSAGFIEHFTNLQLVIQKHVKLLEHGGYLVLGVPNFLGLNGLVQRVFDSANYGAHNLEAMKLEVVLPLLKEAGIEILHASYEGRFGVWLEETATKSNLVRRGLGLLSSAGSIVLPWETKLFSPFCLIIGRKR